MTSPINPTEGVSVGTIIPNTYDTADLDPSTGQEKSVIMTGKCDPDEYIDGRPRPYKLGSTPPLKTPLDQE